MNSGDYQSKGSDINVNHEPAQLKLKIERYLLGEMPPDEETQWEVHYLECSHCLEELEKARTLTQFLKQNAQLEPELQREAEDFDHMNEGRLRRTRRITMTRPPVIWSILAAACVFLAIGIAAITGWMRTGSLQRRVDELQLPSVPQITYSLQGPIRGSEDATESLPQEFLLPKEGGSFLLAIPPLTARERSSIYRTHVVDSQGNIIWTSPDMAFSGMMRRFSIVCQSSFFDVGDYKLRVEEILPGTDEKITEFSFPFRFSADE